MGERRQKESVSLKVIKRDNADLKRVSESEKN
jgi:hypothetical protein